MATIAEEIEVSTARGPVDVAVAAGIMRAGAKLGAARYARIGRTHVDVSSARPTGNDTVRLVVTFVLDD